MPSVRKMKRHPSVSRKAKVVGLILAVLAVALLITGLWLSQQDTARSSADEAADNPPPSRPAITVTSPPPTQETVSVPEIVVIGDSFTRGTEIGGIDAANWTTIAGKALSESQRYGAVVSSDAQGGTGYMDAGPGKTSAPYGERIPAAVQETTDLVVLLGSINDRDYSAADIESAAAQTYASIKEAAPDASILVIGLPWIDENVPATVSAANNAVRSAAESAGLDFVDPLAEEWFFGENPALIGADGIHPTDEGHQYMADLIIPYLEERVAG